MNPIQFNGILNSSFIVLHCQEKLIRHDIKRPKKVSSLLFCKPSHFEKLKILCM